MQYHVYIWGFFCYLFVFTYFLFVYCRDIMMNFEQRWRKQAKTHLFHVGREFISVQEEEIHDDDSWSSRLCRSIDPFSADISYVDNSIQYCYVQAIRNAKRFIYIENQVNSKNKILFLCFSKLFFVFLLVFYGKLKTLAYR